jgi:hypothetical protein
MSAPGESAEPNSNAIRLHRLMKNSNWTARRTDVRLAVIKNEGLSARMKPCPDAKLTWRDFFSNL